MIGLFITTQTIELAAGSVRNSEQPHTEAKWRTVRRRRIFLSSIFLFLTVPLRDTATVAPRFKPRAATNETSFRLTRSRRRWPSPQLSLPCADTSAFGYGSNTSRRDRLSDNDERFSEDPATGSDLSLPPGFEIPANSSSHLFWC